MSVGLNQSTTIAGNQEVTAWFLHSDFSDQTHSCYTYTTKGNDGAEMLTIGLEINQQQWTLSMRPTSGAANKNPQTSESPEQNALLSAHNNYTLMIWNSFPSYCLPEIVLQKKLISLTSIKCSPVLTMGIQVKRDIQRRGDDYRFLSPLLCALWFLKMQIGLVFVLCLNGILFEDH